MNFLVYGAFLKFRCVQYIDRYAKVLELVTCRRKHDAWEDSPLGEREGTTTDNVVTELA